MPKPLEFEVEALKQAGELLKFSAENRKVPDQVAATLEICAQAAATEQWTPEIAEQFWKAYDLLGEAIKPSTVDTVAASTKLVQPQRWKFWRRPQPQPKYTATSYMISMIVLLAIAILLQFVVSTSTQLETEAKKIGDDMKTPMQTLIDDLTVSEKTVSNGTFDATTAQKLTDELKRLLAAEDLGVTKVRLRNDLTTLGLYAVAIVGHEGVSDTVIVEIKRYHATLGEFYENRRNLAIVLEVDTMIITVIGTLLPIMFGYIGACAYVTRLISDQIRDTTFYSTSPIRHRVRVALGALAGVIVGFGWIGSGISYSPLALAFIAGYAVEPVFSTFDSIAAKFRA